MAIYAEKIDTEGVHAFVEVDGLDVCSWCGLFGSDTPGVACWVHIRIVSIGGRGDFPVEVEVK